MSLLHCGARTLDLSRVQIMGILNVTPDSFSDGGTLFRDGVCASDMALRKAEAMMAQGATVLDIGGESTRPGAAPVSEQEELDRVLPVLERIQQHLDVVVSLDTSNATLIREGAARGAGLINDVRALEREGALQAAAESGLPVCLMHMQGSPQTMQHAPSYNSVVEEVAAYLKARVDACHQAGIQSEKILLDPGFGFGKTLPHNLQLLNRLEALKALGFPLLVGTSRKSMIGQVLGCEVDQRLYGSLATVSIAVMKGASIIRVHDVQETADVVRMTEAVLMEK